MAGRDESGNIADIRALEIIVDATPPAAPASLLVNAQPDSTWFNQAAFSLTWTNPQDVAGVAKAFIKVDGQAPINASALASHTVDLGSGAAQGITPVEVWLEDNVGNADPINNKATVRLRHDGVLPAASAVAPSTASALPIPVAFSVSEPGASGAFPTASGVAATVLWYRRIEAGRECASAPGAWTRSVLPAFPGNGAGFDLSTGTFAFEPNNEPPSDGFDPFDKFPTAAIKYCFFAQARDVAGNLVADPEPGTPAHASALFDATPPVLSNVQVQNVTFSQATVSWTTDEATTGVVRYGASPTTLTNTALSATEGTSHAAVLNCKIFSPGTVYYVVEATNKAGGVATTQPASFNVPAEVLVSADDFGVVTPQDTVKISVTNPDITEATIRVNGQTLVVALGPDGRVEVPLGGLLTGDGDKTLSVSFGGAAVFEQPVFADTSPREVRLARLVTDAGGGEDFSGAESMVTVGQAVVGPPADAELPDGYDAASSGQSRLFFGYFAAIDPKPPGPVGNFTAVTGPDAGQVTLSWDAAGDDAGVGTAMKDDLRSAAAAAFDYGTAQAQAAPQTAAAGTRRSAVVGNLADGADYTFGLKAQDELGNAGALASVTAKTYFKNASADLAASGEPVVEFLSLRSDIQIAKETDLAAEPFAVLASQGLVVVGEAYRISPSGAVFSDPLAVIKFRYADPGDAALESQYQIRKFDAGSTQWNLLANLRGFPGENRLEATVGSLSHFAVTAPDEEAPTTELFVAQGSRFVSRDGTLFISTTTRLSLSARDPPVGLSSGTGVALTEYRLSAAAPFIPLADAAATLVFPEGAHTLQFKSTDRAGNAQALQGASFISDGTGPAATFSSQRELIGIAGGVLIAGAGAADLRVEIGDFGGSGVASSSYSLNGGALTPSPAQFDLSLATGTHVLLIAAQDNVGNLSERSFKIVVGDDTPPAVLIASPEAGRSYVATKHQIGIAFTVTDDNDPAPVWTAEIIQREDTGSPRGGRAALLAVATGQVLDPLDLDDGVWELRVTAADFAGNSTAALSGTFSILHDVLPPQTVFKIEASSFPAAQGSVPSTGTVFVRADTFLAFESEDDLIEIGDTDGLGTAFQEARADGALLARFTDPAPGVGKVFRSTAVLAGLADGPHAIGWFAQDVPGNREDERSRVVALDATPPVSSLSVAGGVTASSAGAAGFYASAEAAFVLSARDPVTGGVAAGLGDVLFSLNGATFTSYAEPLTLTEGLWELAYFARDRLENAEIPRSSHVFVDATAPVSVLAVGTPKFTDASGKLFITPRTPLSLIAEDLVSSGIASGVGVIEAAVDAGAFAAVAGELTFPAGAHALAYRAGDRVGNVEAARTSEFVSDGAAPAIVVLSPLSGSVFKPGETLQVSFSVKDDNDPAPAFGATLIQIEDRGAPRGESPASAAVSSSGVLDPLALDDGIWELIVSATDFVLNASSAASGTFEIVHDLLPPRTAFAVGAASAAASAGSIPSDTAVFVRGDSVLTLTSEDDLISLGDGAGFGAAFQQVTIGEAPLRFDNAAPSPGEVFVSTFSLARADGLYSVAYLAEDAFGNREEAKTASLAVDETPPQTAYAISGPLFEQAGRVYVAPLSQASLSAEDPVLGGVASGLLRIEASADGAGFTAYEAPFSFPEGRHTLAFRAFDRLANAETARTVELNSDATAPETALGLLGGRQAESVLPNAFYASTDTAYRLAAEDPVSNEVVSGVRLTEVAIDSGAFQGYAAPFTLTAGVRRLAYRSVDNVGNQEVARSTTVLVDDAPPETAVSVGEPRFTDGGGVLYVSTSTPLDFAAADPDIALGAVGSGVEVTEASVDGAPFTVSSGSLYLAEGLREVRYRSSDRVGNVEAAGSVSLRADATPPLTTLAAGRPSANLDDGRILASPDTEFSLDSLDPESAGVASGVRAVFYRVILGTRAPAFSLYGGTFSLAGYAGTAEVEYFAEDRVLNREARRAASLVIDSSPPALSLASPKPGANGICRVVNGLLTVTGTVSDPYLASYTLEWAPGSGAIDGFTEIRTSTTGADGVLGLWDTAGLTGEATLRLRAVDRVGNASSVAADVYLGEPARQLVLGGEGTFNHPEGVAAGPQDSIYVADTNNDRIRVFDSSGTLLADFGGGTGPLVFNKPGGIAVDGLGNAYVADTNHHRVVKLSPEGTELLELGDVSTGPTGKKQYKPGSSDGVFRHPGDVALGPDGALYVADTGNGRIQIFSPEGAFLRAFDLPFVPGGAARGKPAGLAVDGAGNVYAADTLGGRALKFDASGALAAEGRRLAAILAEGLENPQGIAVSPAGDCVLVSARNGDYVLRLDGQGHVALKFGVLANIVDKAPLPQEIVFQRPAGLALDSRGRLLIADRNNMRIQRFGLPEGEMILASAPQRGAGTVAMLVSKKSGGKVLRSDNTSVDIPPGALIKDTEITISDPPSDQTTRTMQWAVMEGRSLTEASLPVDYGPEGLTFRKPVTITLPYDPGPDWSSSQPPQPSIHYWNPARNDWELLASVYDPVAKTVSAQTMHFSQYQVLAPRPQTASSDFRLREVYVFPNPALRGAAPALHIEVGLADSVSIKIYDVAGREVHSASLSGSPRIVNDQNGSDYAYEYAWNGHIPSGVYLYVVTAEKSGHAAIRKAGKFSVIR